MFLLAFILYVIGYMILAMMFIAVVLLVMLSTVAYGVGYGARYIWGKIRREENPPDWNLTTPSVSITREKARDVGIVSGIWVGAALVFGFLVYAFNTHA